MKSRRVSAAAQAHSTQGGGRNDPGIATVLPTGRLIARLILILKGAIGVGVLAWASVGTGLQAFGIVPTQPWLAGGFIAGALVGSLWGWAIRATR